jgi:class 3 adenylate cyclase
MRSISAWLT